MRAIFAMIGLLALGGCMGDNPPSEQPTMYLSMANGGATLDPQAAASMISLYRQNNGLGAVVVDPDLMKLAEVQSQAMAGRNKVDHDVKGPLEKRLGASGYPAKLVARCPAAEAVSTDGAEPAANPRGHPHAHAPDRAPPECRRRAAR